MTQIVNLILDRLVTHLTQVMQTDIPVDDLTYADLVKIGLLQENKTKMNIGLGITGGDHDNPDYTDGIVTLDDFKNIAFQLPAREIGGGQMWWRRGIVRLECFFIREKLEENTAFNAAYETLGRLLSNLEIISMHDLVDSFDERAIKLFCVGNTFFESGGAPRSFIFRGKVFWQVLTERP